MKILMINVVCGIKSTGRLCGNIAQELEQQGHTVKIAYGREEVPEQYQKYAVRIGTSKDVTLHGIKARTKDASGFGSEEATRRFLEWVKEYDPDVIHLNNLHGYYINIELLFNYLKTCGKKVVWTMHDCWAFSGHSAHCSAIGCTKWMTGCYECPMKRAYPASLVDKSKKNWAKKKELMTGIPNMTIVAPSHWMEQQLSKSFLKQYPVEMIHNGIDVSKFAPVPNDFKQRYNIGSKIMVLGMSTEWTELKGLSDYVSLAERLDNQCQLVLVGVPKEIRMRFPDTVMVFDKTNDLNRLVEFYSAADVFINLSHCENYPTVNLEALACGTPVVTYDVGGSKECLQAGSGKVVPQRRLDKAIQAIYDIGIKKTPVQADRVFMDNKEAVQKYAELMQKQSEN